ncbi:hypothetical protein ACAN107058_23270 [Paracidovorax anthurii]
MADIDTQLIDIGTAIHGIHRVVQKPLLDRGQRVHILDPGW